MNENLNVPVLIKDLIGKLYTTTNRNELENYILRLKDISTYINRELKTFESKRK